jgi:D-glycero-D-manno-heptose 1,7-bisphosphate phosphatase
MIQKIPKTEPDWTLFLDRDGVINIENPLKYINNWDEFIFHEGVKEALNILAARFKFILVVTNQRGVAKGLTQQEELDTIHRNMTAEIVLGGGRIDKIYCCTDMEDTSPNRKPNPGMGFQAKTDFKTIDFSKSVMVGDKLSDMEFGRNLGCKTILLTTAAPAISTADPRVDAVYNSLLDFARSL